MAIRIGTSGFIYDHWRGRFYPSSARGIRTGRTPTFDTVELNVTFYRMPPSSTFRSWAARVPDDFVFAVKASRYLTHVRRLKEPRSIGRSAGRSRDELGTPPWADPHPASAGPGTRPGRARGDPRCLSGGYPRRRRATPRFVVHRGRPACPDGPPVALCVADRADPSPRCGGRPIGVRPFPRGPGTPRSCYGDGELDVWADAIATASDSRARGLRLLQQRRERLRPSRRRPFARAPPTSEACRSRAVPHVAPDIVGLDPGRFDPDEMVVPRSKSGRAWGASVCRSARRRRPHGRAYSESAEAEGVDAMPRR